MAIEAVDTDSDQDGLKDIDEQTIGTHPALADTDDDGRSDYFEVRNGMNPLKVEWKEDYMVRIPADGTITYTVDDIQGKTGFEIEFDAFIADIQTATTLLKRDGQFEVTVTDAGKVAFTYNYGDESGTLTSDAVESAGERTRIHVKAKGEVVSNTLVVNLEVKSYDANGIETIWSKEAVVMMNSSFKDSVSPIVLGGSAEFFLDNVTVALDGIPAVDSDFNDLGATFANNARTKRLGAGAPADPYVGIPSEDATTGSLTDADALALRHSWLEFSGLVGDTDGDGRDEAVPFLPLGLPGVPGGEHAVRGDRVLQALSLHRHLRLHPPAAPEHLAGLRLLRGMRALDVVAGDREEGAAQVARLLFRDPVRPLPLLIFPT